MSTRTRAWTDEEVGFLVENERMSARLIGEKLSRGRQSVQKMRQKIREGGSPLDTWNPGEDEVIRTTGHMKGRDVVALLPGRTYYGVQDRRRHLATTEGLTFGGRKEPSDVGRRTLLAKTCPCCGLLLTPKWYGRNTDGYWKSRCIRCRPPQDRTEWVELRKKRSGKTWADEFYEKVQKITRDRATNSGNEWVAADHVVLDDPETTILSKALRLGRTYAAVSQQCHKNGYPSLVGHGDPIKGQWIIDNPNELVAAS